MFDGIDLERIFRVARERGAESCEIYVEHSVQTTIQARNQWHDVRIAHGGGAAIRLFDGKNTHHFCSSQPGTAALLHALGEQSPAGAQPPSHSLDLAPARTDEKVELISQLMRTTWGKQADLHHASLRSQDTVKRFGVASSRGGVSTGKEESFEIGADWITCKKGKRSPFSSERCRTSIDASLREWRQSNPFGESVQRSLTVSDAWPSPRGEVPVLWSARAVSKLCAQFLRAFEGDRVLANHSFLNTLPFPFELRFTVEDQPDPSHLPCDHEGSPTRSVLLFGEGRPKALAVNHWVASLLSVPSTGHCRRESFLATPTVGFWRPRVLSADGAERVERPLEALVWGLSVRDLDVLRFDPATGAIHLRLNEVTLVHHREEGEAVEPIELRTNLLDLLARFKAFTDRSETNGIAIPKHRQWLITDVTAPAALSTPLPIPGQVPLSHYW